MQQKKNEIWNYEDQSNINRNYFLQDAVSVILNRRERGRFIFGGCLIVAVCFTTF